MEMLQVRIKLQERFKEVEVTGWWTGFGGCEIWPLRAVLCLKTGSLL